MTRPGGQHLLVAPLACLLLVFFGVSVLGRTVSLPLSRAVGAPLPRLRGVTGKLARQNAMRNPKRTAASASALMIGVGLVGFITILASSSTASVNSAIDRSFAGDIVIKTFADLLKRITRSSDICGRLGGDEFLMVMTHVESGHIEATVNRFREQFAALSFPFQGQSVNVTSSFGIAGSAGKETPEFGGLVRKADQMLYEAKRAGRNTVRVSYPQP